MALGAKVKSWVRKGTDLAAAAIFRKAAEKQFGKYGTIREFWLDSARKQAHLDLLLRGESHPVEIFVQRYELLEEERQTCLVIREATASRPWINLLIQDYLIGRNHPLPPAYASAAKKIL